MIINKHKQEKLLVEEILNNNPIAWNTFVKKYSNLIVYYVVKWCNSKCGGFSDNISCEIKLIKQNTPILEDKLCKNKSINITNNDNFEFNTKKNCDLGVDLYVFIFYELKNKIKYYEGRALLSTFIVSCLNNIINDYFIHKYGRINTPTCLKNASKLDQDIYDVICKSESMEEIIYRGTELGNTKEVVLNSFNRILDTLEKANKEVADGEINKVWRHIVSKIKKNTKVNPLTYIDENGKRLDIDVESNDEDYSLKEFSDYLYECLYKLDSRDRRIIELRFQKGFTIKKIYELYKDLFNFKSEAKVYPEIESSVLKLIYLLRKKYSDLISNKADTSAFKKHLEDFFRKNEKTE